jgi:hypothetical protein
MAAFRPQSLQVPSRRVRKPILHEYNVVLSVRFRTTSADGDLVKDRRSCWALPGRIFSSKPTGKKITKISATAFASYVADNEYFDVATAPASLSYVTGTACK